VGTSAAIVDERKQGQIRLITQMGQSTSVNHWHERCTLPRFCLAAYFTDTRPSINIDVYAEWSANPGFW
jgi:hypothetical protein